VTDGNGNVTRLSYDAVDNLAVSTDPLNRQTNLPDDPEQARAIAPAVAADNRPIDHG
jgi:YD repeat-containing protein